MCHTPYAVASCVRGIGSYVNHAPARRANVDAIEVTLPPIPYPADPNEPHMLNAIQPGGRTELARAGGRRIHRDLFRVYKNSLTVFLVANRNIPARGF